MTRALSLLALVATGAGLGCSQSSLAKASLELDSVAPATVSARGGQTLRLRGRGFADGTHVFVRDQQLTANVVDDGTLEATMLPTVAGKADVRVTVDGDSATLPEALTITPIPLAFADAPDWTLPKLPGPVDVLASSAAGPLVGGAWGMSLVAFADGKLSALPVGALATGGGDAGLPPVLAAASSPSGSSVVVCVDATPSLRWLAVQAGALVAKGSADPGGKCLALAMGSVQPEEPWLYALVQTAAGVVVKAWQPGSPPKSVAVDTPPLPPTVDAFAAADLDGDADDDLIVAGTDGTTPTLAAWTRTTDADGTLRFTDEGALPSREERTYALLATDLDGDGFPDIYAAGDGQDALFINDGYGHFADDASRQLPFERASGHAVAAADFDRDGRIDLVVATPAAADRLYVASAAGFDDQTPLLGLEPDLGGNAVVLDDLDHDGDVDVITTTAATHALRVRWLVPPPASP